MKRFLKPWIVMPVVAAIALVGWLAYRQFGGSDSSAATATARSTVVKATTGTMASTVSATGTAAAAQTDNLSFSSSGTVTAVNVAAGDTVKAGQVLASIDSAELAASVSSAESNLAKAQATLSDDTDSGASSAQLTADQTAVTTAEDQLTSAQKALDGANLVATFDGTVASVDLTVGEQLGNSGQSGSSPSGLASGSGRSSASTSSSSSTGSQSPGGAGSSSSAGSTSSSAQIQVVSSGSYTVQVGFDSSDIAKIKLGQTATVGVTTATSNTRRTGGGFGGFGGFGGPGGDFAQQFESRNSNSTNNSSTQQATTTGQTVTGKVTEVGRVATASSGVATYPVTITFEDTSGQINAGATVLATITYSETAAAVQVPSLAVRQGSDGPTVTVVDGSKKTTRSVTTGTSSGGMIQITSGLKDGESVLVEVPSFGSRTGNATTGGSGTAGRGGEFPGGGLPGGQAPGGAGG